MKKTEWEEVHGIQHDDKSTRRTDAVTDISIPAAKKTLYPFACE